MDELKLKKLIQQEIDSYMKNKQFNISKITNHEHNGMDSNKISAIYVKGFLPLPATQGGVVAAEVLGDEIVIQGESRNGYGTFNTVNKVQFPIYPIPTIMGGGNTTPETLTGAVAAGATSATLTGAWAGDTEILTVMFATWGELADVQFTAGSAAISWPAPLENASSASITIVGDAIFKGGEAPYGSAIIYASVDNLYPILYLRVPMEGQIYKWWGIPLTEIAAEYYNSNNAR